MQTEVSSTANSFTEVLLAGDVVLNLTQQPLNAIAGTQFFHALASDLSSRPRAAHVVWQHSLLAPLLKFAARGTQRVVVVSEEGCSDADAVVRELSCRNLPHLHCTLMNSCDADAFMDEEDTEVVTERLRQLGYI